MTEHQVWVGYREGQPWFVVLSGERAERFAPPGYEYIGGARYRYRAEEMGQEWVERRIAEGGQQGPTQAEAAHVLLGRTT
jgi:hypothetical protein